MEMTITAPLIVCCMIDPNKAERDRARYLRRKAAGYKKPPAKRKTFTVDGKILTEKMVSMLHYYPTATTDKQISELCGLASCSVCEARQRLGLPAATASVEEKTKLAQHYLDEVQKQRDLGVAG